MIKIILHFSALLLHKLNCSFNMLFTPISLNIRKLPPTRGIFKSRWTDRLPDGSSVWEVPLVKNKKDNNWKSYHPLKPLIYYFVFAKSVRQAHHKSNNKKRSGNAMIIQNGQYNIGHICTRQMVLQIKPPFNGFLLVGMILISPYVFRQWLLIKSLKRN